MASKDKFDIWYNILPIYAAGRVDVSGGEHILEQSTSLSLFERKGATAAGIKEAFDRLISTMSYSFSGTFEKDGDNVTFKRISE